MLLFTPPILPDWAQQLAGIFPLTALIEFTDLPTKLHVFELAGGVPLWNWPVTPSGARLLLSTLDNSDACCLDREERSTVLQCVDGRYGDCYPSSTPTTTRLAVASKDSAAAARTIHVPNPRLDMPRCQTLTVVLLDRNDDHTSTPANAYGLRRSRSWAYLRNRRNAYHALSMMGWMALCGLLATSLLCGLYIALAYLIVLPLTGLVVHTTHGGPSRRLADEGPSEFQRMVVCTSSWNGTQWYAFIGGSRAVNSLLNKPLFRAGASNNGACAVPQRVWGYVLQVLIAGQWALALASCALMDWNAMIISAWITFCAVSSGYLMRPKDCVNDWLQEDCRIKATPITTKLSSRRALLSALVYLNPDTKERRTSWINPILAHCEERKEWESALLDVVEMGTSVRDEHTKKYWWKFITEGLEIGKAIESIIGDHVKRRGTQRSSSSTGSEPISFTNSVHKV